MFELMPGRGLRVVALVSGQTVELIAHRRDDPRIRLSTTLTTLVEFVHEPQIGTTLWSQTHEPLLEIVGQSHNRHDLQLEACSAFVNGLAGHPLGPSCADNFATALAELGLGPKWIPYPFGIFRRCGMTDDGFQMLAGSSVAGDYVELLALAPVTMVVSVCPLIGASSCEPTVELTWGGPDYE